MKSKTGLFFELLALFLVMFGGMMVGWGARGIFEKAYYQAPMENVSE